MRYFSERREDLCLLEGEKRGLEEPEVTGFCRSKASCGYFEKALSFTLSLSFFFFSSGVSVQLPVYAPRDRNGSLVSSSKMLIAIASA